MNASQEGNALTIDGERPVPLAFPDEKAEQRLRARLRTGQAMSVRIAPTEPSDVQGHSLDLAKDSIWLKLLLEGDDTEGHAIRVTFPSAADADRFRRNMLAAGVLAGSVVLASAGAIALTSNLSLDASAPVTTQAQYMAPAQQEYAIPAGINPATNMPWRSGFQDGSDEGLSGAGAGAAADAAVGADAAAPRHPAGTVGGPLAGNE
ncbi:MAG TPA: hypothetical protein VL687_06095 [Methylomirabilota bacterium]|nr:hypothetical protein [Methylomirabilota bacterium]